MITKEHFMTIAGQPVTILGAERSGISAAKLVARLGGVPFVSDFAPKEKLSAAAEILNSLQIQFECGEHSDRIYNSKFFIVSPGVPTDALPVQAAISRDIPVISELEFASYFCKGKIIAISGTNGKSTTTALIEHLLNSCGHHCIQAGNMGRAFSEVAMDVPANGFVSLEVSSFQLDRTIFFKPNVALLLNITPDHLNRYHFNMQEYVEAKYKVFANQDPGDILVLNADSEYLAPGSITTRAMIRYFSIYRFQDNGINRSEAGEIVSYSNSIPRFRCSVEDLFIRGEHNHANAMAAIEAVLPFVADQQKLIAGLKTFRGIEHRLELVKTIAGVQYINDSKATNIDSVWYALRSYEVPIILILGGIDKGNDYDKIRELVLEKVKKIYAIGESAEKVFKYFHRDVKVELKSTLEECVLSANSESHPGEIVLLSPACASFDMFKNYEHRGEVFKEAVLRLEE